MKTRKILIIFGLLFGTTIYASNVTTKNITKITVQDTEFTYQYTIWLFRSISATLFGSNDATHFSLFRSSERSLAKLIILSVNV